MAAAHGVACPCAAVPSFFSSLMASRRSSSVKNFTQLVHYLSVLVKRRFDQRPSGFGQMNDPRACVSLLFAALDQALALEAVDGYGHGAAGQFHVAANLVDRRWPLVEKQFEDCEVRQAEPKALDISHRPCLHRRKSLPQDKPEVNAGGLLRARLNLFQFADMSVSPGEPAR